MKNNNQINIPEARAAMDKFKMEAASEVGVNLKEGYNGDLTSREAGSVGGQMVKKMVEAYEPPLTNAASPPARRRWRPASMQWTGSTKQSWKPKVFRRVSWLISLGDPRTI